MKTEHKHSTPLSTEQCTPPFGNLLLYEGTVKLVGISIGVETEKK